MSMNALPKVLCVDDEQNLLNAITRTLRKVFDIHTATGGAEGLEILKKDGPFEVVVSDMRMPGMNGAEFLRHVREQSPESVRLLLTGFAELETVVTAVNEGYIYRFLSKPCTGRVLHDAIVDAVTQHRLITAERVLLEQTLRGCINAVSEVLALAAPAAFGRATRICQIAMLIGRQVGHRDLWQIEVSSTLSQLAYITLPQNTALKIYNAQDLAPEEEEMVTRLPAVTRQILNGIPRLEPIYDVLRCLDLPFAPEDALPGVPTGKEIPVGARILGLANLLEALQTRGESPQRSLEIARARKGQFDPQLLDAFATICDDGAMDFRTRSVDLFELRHGMVLASDVASERGVLLVPAGQTITVSLLEKIRNFARTVPVKEPVWVRLSPAEIAAASPVPRAPEFTLRS
jgi:response regulator RpfG family c-di-GMP phosphodiesterase